MARIRVQNFGPIKEGCLDNEGWIDIKKATFFTGNQGSGKSTLAKLISTLLWIEKQLYREGKTKTDFHYSYFKSLFSFHNIRNYFTAKTVIEFEGDLLSFKTEGQEIKKGRTEDKQYLLPKIMYVPSERNFLSTIKNAFDVKGMPENLFAFAEEFRKAQKACKDENIDLGIAGHKYFYDFQKDESYIKGSDFQLRLSEASSGYQSYSPLFVVTRWLSKIILRTGRDDDKNLLSVNRILEMAEETNQIMDHPLWTEKEKHDRIKSVRNRYYPGCFINIIEEPEQNLFPSSQWEMLKELMYYANYQDQNKLIVTTHSPYLINFISIIAKAYSVYQLNLNKEQKERLQKIVPEPSVVHPEGISIYEFDEHNGTIKKLPDYKGIPSDDNYLNNGLGTANDLFVELLEIEEECQ